MFRIGERDRLKERLEEPLSATTTIVRHERDPMSGWIMAFMVLVVLVGLGFISLMDLSAQQTKTERTLFQVQQELRRSKIAAQPNVDTDLTHDEVYSRLNESSVVEDGTEIDALPPPSTSSDPPSTTSETTTTTTTTTADDTSAKTVESAPKPVE